MTCPVCGAVAEYNAYYGRITCTRCSWTSEHIQRPVERKAVRLSASHMQRFPVALMRLSEDADVKQTNGTIFGRDKDGASISYATQGLSSCDTIAVIDPNGYESKRSDRFFKRYITQAIHRGESIVLAGDSDRMLEQYIRSQMAEDIKQGGYRVEVFDVFDPDGLSIDMTEELKHCETVLQAYDRAERYAATFMEHTTYDAPLDYDTYWLAQRIIRLRFTRPQFYGTMSLPDMRVHGSVEQYMNPNPGASLFTSPKGVPDRLNTDHWQLVSCNTQKALHNASEFGESLLFRELEKLGERAKKSGMDVGKLTHDMFRSPAILIIRWADDFRRNALAALVLSAVTDILASKWPFRKSSLDDRDIKPTNIVIRDLASVGYIDGLWDVAVKARSRGINTVIGMKELDTLTNKRIDVDKIITACDTKLIYPLSKNTKGRNAHPYANAPYWRYLSSTFTDQVLLNDESITLLFAPRCKNPVLLRADD